jgi:hypothetical protein
MTDQEKAVIAKYRRLRNTELPDATENWVPVITAVYENPITRDSNEGLAILREPDLDRCSDDWWDGRIEFVDEPGQYYSKRVWRKVTPV